MIRSSLRRLGAVLLDVVFPLRCVGCGAWDTLLCDRCRSELPFIPGPVCPRCGVPQTNGPLAVCPDCQRHPLNALDAAWACFRFDGIVQDAIHDLKYRGISTLAEPFGALLGEHLPAHTREQAILVPVPLHASRLSRRGYNQAALLARAAGRTAGLTVWEDALVRTRPTPTQTALDIAGRRANVRDAFACVRPDVAGQNIVLVDDVITTGATMDACAAALKAAGARQVWGCALAREL